MRGGWVWAATWCAPAGGLTTSLIDCQVAGCQLSSASSLRGGASQEGHVAQDVELRTGLGGGQVALHGLAAGGVGGVGVQNIDALSEPATVGGAETEVRAAPVYARSENVA